MPALSPDAAHHRARIAALSRSRPPNDPELVDERQKLADAQTDAWVQKTLDEAPELTTEQRAKLAVLLEPARQASA
jgi:hypothetical protein